MSTTVLLCVYCGDACDEKICYACTDTLDAMGIEY